MTQIDLSSNIKQEPTNLVRCEQQHYISSDFGFVEKISDTPFTLQLLPCNELLSSSTYLHSKFSFTSSIISSIDKDSGPSIFFSSSEN